MPAQTSPEARRQSLIADAEFLSQFPEWTVLVASLPPRPKSPRLVADWQIAVSLAIYDLRKQWAADQQGPPYTHNVIDANRAVSQRDHALWRWSDAYLYRPQPVSLSSPPKPVAKPRRAAVKFTPPPSHPPAKAQLSPDDVAKRREARAAERREINQAVQEMTERLEALRRQPRQSLVSILPSPDVAALAAADDNAENNSWNPSHAFNTNARHNGAWR